MMPARLGERNAPCRLSSLWLGAALAAILPLGGCVSDGASSFTQVLDIRQQEESAEALPLDVASTGVVDATQPKPVNPVNPAALPGVEPSADLALSADSLVARSLAGEQQLEIAALAPDTTARETQAQTTFAAVTPAAPIGSASLNGNAMTNPGNGLPVRSFETEDAAAEQRATQLYASMTHGECKGGWGPKPKMINAKRIDPSHKFYMEIRLRHTPPLPVGHVYIAYGRIGPDGEPLDEKLVMLAPVGGYAGATIAAAAPVTGVLTPYGDDCILRPIGAYRVSLKAAQYERLLQRIVQAQADKPRYALWTYNCNHFMSDIAASVGILPPENKYSPSLEYFYSMMDRNEGRKVARSLAEDAAKLTVADNSL